MNIAKGAATAGEEVKDAPLRASIAAEHALAQGRTRSVRKTMVERPLARAFMSRGGPVLVLALGLSGCGLHSPDRTPSGPADAPAARIVPRAPLHGFPAYAGAPHFTVEAVRGEGDYVHAPRARTVRVGVEDDGVDHTREVFEGRIDIRGATFAWWRPDIGRDPGNGAPSRIYVVDSRRDDIQAAIRAIVESDPQARLGGAFVHDIAGGPAAWFEIPPLGVTPSPERDGAAHGTAVASVLAREAARHAEGSNVAIVPMAVPFDNARDVSSWLLDHLEGLTDAAIDAAARDRLLVRSVSLLTTTSLSELHGRFDPGGPEDPSARAFDAVWARAVAAKLESVDIVNISAGSVYPCAAIDPEAGAICRAEFLRQHRNARRALPDTARAIAQAHTPDADKTLVVWGAGNLRTVLGDGARDEAMELVSSFEDMRGHNIGVTALDGARTGLAEYAHFCGTLPADWDAAADGEHYCLAAPGVHEVDYPYNPGPVTDQGTSYAAPVVSATLAMMKDRFRGQLGNVELVKRLMATADDRLHEDDDPVHDGTTSVAVRGGRGGPGGRAQPGRGACHGRCREQRPSRSDAAPGALRLRRCGCTDRAGGDRRLRCAQHPVLERCRRSRPGRPGCGGPRPALRGWRRGAGELSSTCRSCPALGLPAVHARRECASSRRTRRGGAARAVVLRPLVLGAHAHAGPARRRCPGRVLLRGGLVAARRRGRPARRPRRRRAVVARRLRDPRTRPAPGCRWPIRLHARGRPHAHLLVAPGPGAPRGQGPQPAHALAAGPRGGRNRTPALPDRAARRRDAHVRARGVPAPPVLSNRHRAVVAPPARGAGRGHRLNLPQSQSGACPEPGRLRRGRGLANALVGVNAAAPKGTCRGPASERFLKPHRAMQGGRRMSPTGEREESRVDPHQRHVDKFAGALYEMVHADLETAPAFDDLKADRRARWCALVEQALELRAAGEAHGT